MLGELDTMLQFISMEVAHTANKPQRFSLTCQTEYKSPYTSITRKHKKHTQTVMITIVDGGLVDLPHAVGGGCEHQEEDENQQDARDSWD